MITVQNTDGLSASEATYITLKRLGWKPKHDKILLKPNVGATSLRANTDPEVARGVIKYLKELGITDIVIGEGSVVTEYESTGYNFHFCGWDKLAKEENVQLVDLNTTNRENSHWFYGILRIPTLMRGRSYVNIAKMKTHMQTLVSVCMKNQKGLLNPETRKLFHRLGLHEAVAHLAEAIQPELCVVDAIDSLEGSGPGELGKTKKTNLIIAGYDMLEVDVACCRFMGVCPQSVEHIKAYAEFKGVKDLYDYGHSVDPSNFNFERPEKEFKMFRVHMVPHPTACTACLSSVGKTNKFTRQKSWKGKWYFIKHGILGRLDIIVGNPPDLPKDHGFCVFYGSCSRPIALKHPEYPYIEGCPPVSKQALEKLLNFGNKGSL